jgi:lauroyl/myristoyl acyltransferase
MIYEHPVEPPSAEAIEADKETATREFTQRCTDVLEMYVRRHPDLWLWMHRRWRDANPGAPGESAGGTPGMFPAAESDTE